MSGCDLSNSPVIELYFYGELDAAERAQVEAHLHECHDCAQRLQDLHAIRSALAARPRVEAPPAGDWSGFTRRLDEACGIAQSQSAATSRHPGMPRAAGWVPALALVATIALVSIGVTLAARFGGTARTAAVTSSADASTSQAKSRLTSPSPAQRDTSAQAQRQGAGGRSLVEQTEEHFERSKLVVLGLAARDPHSTPAADWQYERQLAGSLLSDTRLYRLAAQNHGLPDLARVMGDLETVLLEASLSDQKDPEALDRLQRLIRKRDLVVKMQVVNSSGI